MSASAKSAVGAAVMTATIAYVIYLGASSSWQYYLMVDECVTRADELHGKRLRVNGCVAAGSLSVAADRRGASFVLQGNEHGLAVSCTGPLPDNLAEGMDVVVEGALRQDGSLRGEKVITRCASKYAPAVASGPSEEGSVSSPAP
jgi:cytochrome c-type biogenesis protein CcmE